MSKLIKYELYKIFHKKVFIVYLLFLFAIFAILVPLVMKIGERTEDKDLLIQEHETIINSFKDRTDLNEDEKSSYIFSLTVYDVETLIKEKNYNRDDAYAQYVDTEIRDLYTTRNTIKVYGSDAYGTTLEEINQKIEEEIKKLDTYNPLDKVREKLNNIDKDELMASYNVSNDLYDQFLEVYKKVLNYRIEMNVPFSYKAGSQTLDNYLDRYNEYLLLDKKKDILTTDQKEIYKDLLSDSKVVEYMMDNKKLTDESESKENFALIFVDGIVEFNFFIILGLLLIASGIISDELDKGTIKQLLVKPFTRNKIFMSKLIASMIIVLFFMMYITLLNVISNFLVYNQFDFSNTIIQYDYSLGKVVEINAFKYWFMIFKSVPFMYLIMCLVVLLISVIFGSTAFSLISGFAMILLPEILAMFMDKFKWLAYLPFFTWDMSCYNFGGEAKYPVLNHNLQLLINIGYVIIFLSLGLYLFKKKDIKNQ